MTAWICLLSFFALQVVSSWSHSVFLINMICGCKVSSHKKRKNLLKCCKSLGILEKCCLKMEFNRKMNFQIQKSLVNAQQRLIEERTRTSQEPQSSLHSVKVRVCHSAVKMDFIWICGGVEWKQHCLGGEILAELYKLYIWQKTSGLSSKLLDNACGRTKENIQEGTLLKILG